MCAIVGFIDFSGAASDVLERTVRTMADAVGYRGPDSSGTFVDAQAGLALGHRRLSIVDLSPAGHQPMTSACGRYGIIYNGEIYNGAEVATELGHINWRGHSDTEVLLEACAAWGVEKAVGRFIGMFAFALWDRSSRRLSLVRDRLGIKPLYFGRRGDLFLFGSELKALRAHRGWTPRVSQPAIASYLRLGYVPAPLSALEGIEKLKPGHILHLDANGKTSQVCFWNLREKAIAGQRSLLTGSPDEIVEALDSLLRDAVRRRMVADVPLGAFLSGGIDSPTVVSLMQAQSSTPIRTFTIGSREKNFNEAGRAAAIARHLGTQHTELIVEPDEARAVIPLLPSMFDEPFADYSQIPTFLVSQLARTAVTVSLSGDGGDEVFAGYTRYQAIEKLWRWTGGLPGSLRGGLCRALRSLSPSHWDTLLTRLPGIRLPSHPGDKIHKAADIIQQLSPDRMYGRLVSLNPDATTSADQHLYPWDDDSLQIDIPALVARLRAMDMLTYLPDDILTKLDRATMAVSLEGRVPLLDHRVVEFGWRVPRDLLIRDGQTKWALRQVLNRYVPAALVDQPKMGFSIPLGDWLRGPLREWAEDLLSSSALADAGLVAAAPVRKLFDAHCAGAVNRPHEIWTVLMLQAWHRHWFGRTPV